MFANIAHFWPWWTFEKFSTVSTVVEYFDIVICDIPENVVDVIGLMYQEKRTRDLIPDGNTHLFWIAAGVFLGDTLALYTLV